MKFSETHMYFRYARRGEHKFDGCSAVLRLLDSFNNNYGNSNANLASEELISRRTKYFYDIFIFGINLKEKCFAFILGATFTALKLPV